MAERPPATPREFFRHWLGEGGRRDASLSATDFFHIERSYWSERHQPNLLLVHYNDLQADLDGEMRRIAAFLDIPVDETLWPDLVRAATFESMKQQGDALLAGMERAFAGGHQSFLHKGTNGRWQGELTDDDLRAYASRLAAETPRELAAWLENGRLQQFSGPTSST